MSGRYAFSLPEPQQRDGWFRLGNIDVTTTVLVVLVSLGSMVLYALTPELVMNGAFSSELVRDGEAWRLFTWPLVNPPSIWGLIDLVVFWYFGHLVEEQIGRKPFAWLLTAMTVIPAVFVTLLNTSNDLTNGRWSAYSFSVALFSLALISIFGIDNPNAKFLFGIPAWVIAAAFVFIQVLQLVSVRAWAQLILTLLVIVVGCFGARQRGMLDVLSFIPRIKQLSGPAPSPYGEIGSARPKPKGAKRFRRSKGGAATNNPVVPGPWGPPGGPTPLEQAELDVLLDRISASGIDSLTPYEKDRLNALSKRMRGS
jgi:membrane associated rhomboid family serine protease